MSSKLYHPEDGKQSTPIAWRPAGGGAPRPSSAHTPRRAEAAPATESGVSEAEIQLRLQAAQKQAYSAGEAAGFQKAIERLTPALASFDSMLKQMTAQSAKVRHDAEAGTVDLSIAIAKRILHREVSVDPEAILGLVKSAGTRLNARETHRLRVSQEDAALLQEHRARLNLPQALEIAADSGLPRGSVIFETSRGEMDASISTQLEEIQRGLTDLVRRRT